MIQGQLDPSRLTHSARTNLMKMHFIVYFMGLLLVLTAVKCSGEHVENNNVIPSGNDDQDDDGSLNGINLNIDEREINEGLPSSWELRKNKCGKTKKACKVAGGYCLGKTNEDECDRKLLEGKQYCYKNNKCGCCVPDGKPTCTRNSEGFCVDYSYRRKYTRNGKPCVIGDVGTQEPILIRNECSKYFGDPQERCIYRDTNNNNNLLFDLCGGDCDIPEKFREDHMCPSCNTVEKALQFTLDRVANGDPISRNHVFRSGLIIGKGDWAFNSNPKAKKLQQICRLPEYVLTWYCQELKKGWKCWEIGYYTGGGLAKGVEHPHVAGHYLTTSLQEYKK